MKRTIVAVGPDHSRWYIKCDSNATSGDILCQHMLPVDLLRASGSVLTGDDLQEWVNDHYREREDYCLGH